jgi:hypothetical protein
MMTKLELAALEYFKAIEIDDPSGREGAIGWDVIKAEGNLKETAVLWAQGYAIKQEEERQRVKALLEETRTQASKTFPGCEFLPGDDIPTIPVYRKDGKRGVVIGETKVEDGDDTCRWWWKVKFDHMPGYVVLEYPPYLITTEPQK